LSDLLGEAVAAIRTALAGVVDVQPLYLPAQAKADLLRDLVEVEAQVAELRLRVLGVAHDLVARDGAHDVGAWFAAAMPVDAAVARADADLKGAASDPEYTLERLVLTLAGLRER